MPVQRWSERIWVAQLAEDPAFTEEVEALLQHARAARAPSLVLDLSGVRHINSANLSHLLQLRRQMIEADLGLCLAAPPNAIWALFMTTGLDKVFTFAPDTPTALARLQMKQQG